MGYTKSRQDRRRRTLAIAKQVLKERGWPRHRLHQVWKTLMSRYPTNPYERGGLFDRMISATERREAQEDQMLTNARIEIGPEELAQLRAGSPLFRPSWWRRLISWLRRAVPVVGKGEDADG